MTVEEKNDKKEQILDVAEVLFADLGFDGTSTRLLAKEAGVNMAMLNYYFGGKEGLFVAVFDRKISVFRANLQNINNDKSLSSWQKIEKWISGYTSNVIKTNNFQRIIYRELSLSNRSAVSDHIVNMLSGNLAEVKKIIYEGIENKSFKNADVEMIIASIIGTKVFLINASPLASKVFDRDFNDADMMQNEIGPRIKTHLLNMLEGLLLE